MNAARDRDKRITRPVEELPVLTEEVDVQLALGMSRAQRDSLVAQIERAVLEELTPRLEDAVHQAVRAAVDQAFTPPARTDPKI